MSSPLPTTVRMKDQDANFVYFCENSCHTSYSGCVDGDSSITAQEISEFIRHSNSSLYEKLNGVQIASSYLPGDDYQEPHDTSVDESRSIPETIEDTSASQFCERDTKFDHTTGSSDPDCPNEIDLTSNFKPGPCHAVEPIVLEGRYHFTFYRHCEPGTVYCCSSPTCPHPGNLIPEGSYFGIIRDEALSEKNDRLTDYERTAYYCLDCLDEVVDREQQPTAVHKMLPPLVDGAQPDRNLILRKALEIYPTLKENEFFFVRLPCEGEPDMKSGEGSNSKNVIRLRRQKQLEIHRIVQDLKQQQFAVIYRTQGGINKKPNPSGLKILVPSDAQPYRERYKKQGLQWVDRLDGYKLKKAWRAASRPAARDTSVPDPKCGDMLVCYCREPAGKEPMLRCTCVSCMFGPIHFRCSGLAQLPPKTKNFWCDYCKSSFTGDLRKVYGVGLLKRCTSKTKSDLGVLDMEMEDGDSTGTICSDEEDNDGKDDIVSPAHGFVAVNRVVSEGA